ncbi:hypothetical protein [Kineosporia succinea]|uniref:DUF58 domain-containing protein n=1 Tax=Kineosporia succinea TaxID=84632 RepID=A0ABT9NYJ4_9ACTN|nr:hypothetical protein [Kineosporia succinea]MDP9825209.1 hypothetical protein [Kineosporia succinea]
MIGWLSGMTGNLVADLIALLVAWAVGVRFVDRIVASKVVASPEFKDSREGAQIRTRLDNLSSEPVLNVSVVSQFWPDDQDDMFLFSETGLFQNDGSKLAPPTLLAGGTAFTQWIPCHGEEQTYDLSFDTVRGGQYWRRLRGPRRWRLVVRLEGSQFGRALRRARGRLKANRTDR